MRRIWAISTEAPALAMVFSRSLANRRQRPGHAKVRSTTHLHGSTLNPLAVSGRLTICNLQCPTSRRAPQSFGPA